MYNYVHTLGAIPSDLETTLLNQYVDNYLFSLIMGLRQGEFGHNTVIRAAKYIKELRNTLGLNKRLMIDSGGYSIIVGDVPFKHIKKCIECYNYYLETYCPNDCDFMLSLDIPIFLNEPNNNTANNIYTWNRESIRISKEILEKNENLYNKFIFVWHFKIIKQFNIWRNIYDEFFRDDNKLKNYAIGGLVSLRGITNINFSPFIIPAFKILKMILERNGRERSLLHILGVYHKYDRFALMFMDKLFNDVYLKNENPEIELTFDTVNYTISGLYKIREMPTIILDEETNEVVQKNAHELENEIDHLIENEEVRMIIKNELCKIKTKENMNNPKLVSLLMVVYNQLADKLMMKMIQEENLLELFRETKNPNNFVNQFNGIFTHWEKKYPFVFRGMRNNLCENFRWLKSADQLWEIGVDEKKWDSAVIKFAQRINFPFDLNGDFNYG